MGMGGGHTLTMVDLSYTIAINVKDGKVRFKGKG